VDFVQIICAIFLPRWCVPAGGELEKDFWINILLTLLGFIPGLFTPSGSSPESSDPHSLEWQQCLQYP